MMVTVTITIDYHNIEAEVMVHGTVEIVSDRMGYNDEPPGVYFYDMEYLNPMTGKPVSDRLQDWIEIHYSEQAMEALLCEHTF